MTRAIIHDTCSVTSLLSHSQEPGGRESAPFASHRNAYTAVVSHGQEPHGTYERRFNIDTPGHGQAQPGRSPPSVPLRQVKIYTRPAPPPPAACHVGPPSGPPSLSTGGLPARVKDKLMRWNLELDRDLTHLVNVT